MTKRCVKIAYGSEMVEKGMKIGRVGLLSDVSRMRVKAHTHRHDPTYLSPFPHTQNLKNIPTYARTEQRIMNASCICKLENTHARRQTKAILQHFRRSIIQN